MPKDKRHNTLERQWATLRKLPTRGQPKDTQQIWRELQAAGYDIDLRTVQRDLADLERYFGITRHDGKPSRWSWSNASHFFVDGLPVADTLVIGLLNRFIQPLLPESITGKLQPVFDAAAQRLATLRHNTFANWSELVEVTPTTLRFVPPEMDGEVLAEIQAALIAGEQVNIDYITSDERRRADVTITPLGLVLAGSITYLICSFPKNSGEPIGLPVHRIHGARRSFDQAKRPPKFRLKDWVESGGLEFGSGEEISVTLRVSRVLAQHLRASKLSLNQSVALEADGAYAIVEATVRRTWRLEWWLLSKTGDLEVLSPMDLRRAIGDRLRDGARLYDRRDGPPTEHAN